MKALLALRPMAAAVLGLVMGAALMLGIQRPAAVEAPTPPAPVDSEPTGPDVLLVWTPGRLPEGLEGGVRALPGITRVTAVTAGMLELRRSFDSEGRLVDDAGEGWAYPLDALAFDPRTFPDFLPKSELGTLRRLGPGEVVLGATSARLRRLAPGGVLELADGRRLSVAAVVDDNAVAGAEIALTVEEGAALGLSTPRYLLAEHVLDRIEAERRVRGAVPSEVPVRVRARGETPFLRHGDAVLPQVFVKEQFGEFRFRHAAGRDIVQDPAWSAAQLQGAHVPILGEVLCHRVFLPALRGAMEELERRNLAWLVDPAGFAGCHAARLVREGGGLSRHAWGAAVDLNWHKNPLGRSSVQDPRLVEVMRRWGLTWGGQWLVPDAAHFEYLRPPE